MAWREIAKRAQDRERDEPDELKNRLEQLRQQPGPYSPEDWDRWAAISMKPWERAVCSIYIFVCLEYAIKRPAVHKTALDAEVDRWRRGANLCREASDIPHRAAVNPELRRAMEMVGAYFAHWADFMDEDNLSMVERSGKKDIDPAVRVRARAVALHLQSILGMACCGTVETIMHVVFGDEAANITEKDIRYLVAASNKLG